MKLVLTSLTCAALFLSGCANMSETQQGTAKGAGIGAVAGAVIGAATGGSKGAAQGAVLGGAVGAGGGYLWSQRMQQQKAAMEQATVGTGVAVRMLCSSPGTSKRVRAFVALMMLSWELASCTI